MIICQARVYVGALDRSWVIAAHEAATPRAALRWLRGQAGRAADQLDPRTDRAPWGLRQWRTAETLRRWRDDMATHEDAITELALGRPVSVNATEPTALITLTAVPQGTGEAP
ncbi:hypothetical protein ACJBCE_37050 [Streptomyces sp. NBUL23]|uniref:hypothetical protein n=1 Tax=Streptomyces sp. NBUL23 TaxID=3381354 RepID=UPI0038715DE0